MTLKPRVEFKKCRICGRILQLADFHKLSVRYKKKLYTHRPECKDCRNANERQAHAEGRRYRRRGYPKYRTGVLRGA